MNKSVPEPLSDIAVHGPEVWLGAMPHICYVLDEERRFVFVNPLFEALLDMRLDDIRGRNLFEVFPSRPESEMELERCYAEAFAGRPSSYDALHYPIPGPDGVDQERWWDLRLSPIPRDAEGDRN